MRAPGVISLTMIILLVAAACGASGGGREVQAVGAPTVPAVTPAQAQPPTTTTTVAPPNTSLPKEAQLPDGAHHGDQPEVVQHFDQIDRDGDCDWLRTERDADREARDEYLTQRAADDSARGKAEVADRWMQAAQNRMRNLRCPVQTPLAGTP